MRDNKDKKGRLSDLFTAKQIVRDYLTRLTYSPERVSTLITSPI